LNQLKLCPVYLSKSQKVFVNIDQLKLSDLNTRGLLAGENTTGYTQPTDGGSNGLPSSGYAAFAPGTSGDVTHTFTINENLPTSTLKGRLKTKTQDGSVINYSLGNVEVTVFRNNKMLGDANVNSNGIFSFPVRIFTGSTYKVMLKIEDKTKITDPDYTAYLYRQIDVLIPQKQNAEISAGNVMLITKDGKYCGTDVICWKAQKSKSSELTIKVINGITGELLYGAGANVTVELYKWWHIDTDKGNFFKSNTNLTGNVVFSGIIYNSYIATVKKNDTWITVPSKLLLQNDKDNTFELVLVPKHSAGKYMLLFDIPMNMGIDFDLSMKMKSITNKECIVNAENRYCPYARHVRDVKGSSGGTEIIQVNKFAVANYMVYASPSPSYKGTCPQASIKKGESGYQYLSLSTMDLMVRKRRR